MLVASWRPRPVRIVVLVRVEALVDGREADVAKQIAK
jgi:hypothetical protein